jgi:pimeloyl-ACP methyl ester carboxylesterase
MPSHLPQPSRAVTRRRRPVGRILLALLVVGGLLLWGLRDTSPISHFADRTGREAFAARYAEAMTRLPRPERTLDLRTAYGVVRVYRFRGADDRLPPLVLLPGWSSATPLWADNLPSLLRSRSVYAVDLLGEPGLSVPDSPVPDNQGQAAWLAEVLTQLPEPRVHVLGLSFGGLTAANWAVREPALAASGKVASLTLVEPVLVFADLPLEVILRSIPASLPWLPKAWRDSFLSWTAGGAVIEDDVTTALIEESMRSHRRVLPGPQRISEEQLRTLELPVLVVLAGRSPMHDSAAAAEVARANLRAGTVTTYPDASHAINGEYPDLLAADVESFLQRSD